MEQQGVYVSVTLQEPSSKWLFSTSRDTWAEAKQDLKDMFGDQFDLVMDGINVVPESCQEVRVTLHPANSDLNPLPMTVDEVAEALGTTVPTTGTFETCKCGYLKDKWIAPGVARASGKPYPGFWACGGPRHK